MLEKFLAPNPRWFRGFPEKNKTWTRLYLFSLSLSLFLSLSLSLSLGSLGTWMLNSLLLFHPLKVQGVGPPGPPPVVTLRSDNSMFEGCDVVKHVARGAPKPPNRRKGRNLMEKGNNNPQNQMWFRLCFATFNRHNGYIAVPKPCSQGHTCRMSIALPGKLIFDPIEVPIVSVRAAPKFSEQRCHRGSLNSSLFQ